MTNKNQGIYEWKDISLCLKKASILLWVYGQTNSIWIKSTRLNFCCYCLYTYFLRNIEFKYNMKDQCHVAPSFKLLDSILVISKNIYRWIPWCPTSEYLLTIFVYWTMLLVGFLFGVFGFIFNKSVCSCIETTIHFYIVMFVLNILYHSYILFHFKRRALVIILTQKWLS